MDFEYDEDSSAYSGCGAILMGEMWYFGGVSKYKTQVRTFLLTLKLFCYR